MAPDVQSVRPISALFPLRTGRHCSSGGPPRRGMHLIGAIEPAEIDAERRREGMEPYIVAKNRHEPEHRAGAWNEAQDGQESIEPPSTCA